MGICSHYLSAIHRVTRRDGDVVACDGCGEELRFSLASRKAIAVGGIWLRHVAGQLTVLAEVEGEWRVVIEERINDPHDPISHIVEPSGIAGGRPPAWLHEAAAQKAAI